MNRSIFIIVVITFIVSIIQIKNPTFFLNPYYTGLEYIGYLQQGRCFSIFNWVDINSLGITFPIMISILISINNAVKITFPGAIIAGIIVSFLTKARYIMISAIIVFSQLFFTLKIDFRKKIYIILILFICVIMIAGVAKIYDYNIQGVIDERVLEKGTNMASANARVKSLEVFIVKFPEHPILGVGPATGEDVLQLLQGVAPIIHVGYLSYLYYYGIVGFLILILSLFYLLKNAWIVGTKYMFWGSFYGLLAFCIANFTFVYFNLSEMGIILAVIYIKYFNDKSLLNLSEDEKPQVVQEENQEFR